MVSMKSLHRRTFSSGRLPIAVHLASEVGQGRPAALPVGRVVPARSSRCYCDVRGADGPSDAWSASRLRCATIRREYTSVTNHRGSDSTISLGPNGRLRRKSLPPIPVSHCLRRIAASDSGDMSSVVQQTRFGDVLLGRTALLTDADVTMMAECHGTGTASSACSRGKLSILAGNRLSPSS